MGKELQPDYIDSDDTLGLYLHDIGKTPLLTEEEEIWLAQSIENGVAANSALRSGNQSFTLLERQHLEENVRNGAIAKNRMIEANTRLVVSKAKRYATSAFPLLDLVQEGNLGLMRAADKYDYRKGYRFSTYAGWWIRHAITRYIATNGRSFDQEESLEEMILDQGDSIAWDKSIDANPQQVIYDRHRAEDIDQALVSLPIREERVIRQRFGFYDGIPKRLQEVGENFGLTRERIRQLETEGLTRLRSPQRLKVLQDYLDS